MIKYKISDIAKVVNGSTPSTSCTEYYNGDILWITPKDLSEQNSKYIYKGERTITQKGYESCSTTMIPANNILLSSRAPIGLISINKNECCTNQGFKNLVIDDKKCDVEYLYYYLKLHIKEIEALGSGTTFKEVSKKSLEDYCIELPALEKQKKSIEILKKIDDKILVNSKINIELESLAKTIFEHWFFQFEFFDSNNNPYKSSGGKFKWSKLIKKNVPHNWNINNLSYFIKTEKTGDWGKEEKTRNYVNEVICIRGADFPALLGKEKVNSPTRYILDKNKNKKLEKNDIIIEISGGSPTQSTGRVCYINENTLKRFNSNIIISNFCKAITLNDNDYCYWFYLLWKTLYENNVLFKYEGKTTGIKNLLFDMLCKDYFVPTPDKDVVKKFNQKVSIMFETIQKNCRENEELEKIKNFLLPLIINGKINFE